ncbi:hypothetical protein JoomaDRAFT_1786 [Galbibacter orientalis DSM 19592]|uniref:DUF4251 domain-containing protein n=1 Tax=Galbibacter orientalis DSM 19592 TaxID=926559 RepID=I3C5A0_9FLAO|nr:hypothetical protein [Galbibacter orientalis]EIJ38793.1 hypothetical protein JoomaDRAFT_1786 [Galbibacter orientalis DSM 19592]
MNKTWILFVIVLLTALFGTAQDNVDVMGRFVIMDATMDGKDITSQLLSKNAFLAFYQYKGDKEIYFANVWPKADSYSNGIIYNLTLDTPFYDRDGYNNQRLTFYWKYWNSYNADQGNASVEMKIIKKPQGNHFIIKIIPEDLEILIYKGFVEGSLDLDVYQKN